MPLIEKESWINAYWRPIAAITYLVICICDFIILPWIFGLKSPSPHEIAIAVRGLDPQVAAVIASPHPQWQPLTLMGSGLFHIAFGAIVGVTAWTRGVAHIEGIKNKAYGPYDDMVDQMQPGYNQTYPYQQQYQPPYPQNPYQQQYPYQPPYNTAQPPYQQNGTPPASGNNEEVDNPDL
jgi:hypothetical protein